MEDRRMIRARHATRRLLPLACLLAACLWVTAAPPVGGQAAPDALEQGFKDPPEAARPRAWWHWMNGNVTKAGITADLEWMKRVGIGGMQMFDGNLSTPQFVDQRLVWMTPEWKDAFRHAASEADRLGLEMTMAASGGWSESGGPTVKPEQAMKKVVWSETLVEGPKAFNGKLRQPPSVNGLFQDIPRPPGLDFPTDNGLPGAKPLAAEAARPPDTPYYADTKVIAIRVPEGDVPMSDLKPKVTSSASGLNLDAITDGDMSRAIEVPIAPGANDAWIQLEFAAPFHARAFTFASAGGGQFTGAAIPDGRLVSSQDGTNWTPVVTLPGPGHPFAGFPIRTVLISRSQCPLLSSGARQTEAEPIRRAVRPAVAHRR